MYDGDVELGLRRYCVIMTYISFVFRIFIILIFWKLSVDFNRLVKSKLNESEIENLIEADYSDNIHLK